MVFAIIHPRTLRSISMTNSKTRWAPVAFLAFISFLPALSASRSDYPELFPEETLFYLEIPSFPQLEDDWKANPIYELYKREDVKDFVDELLEAITQNFGSDDESNPWIEDENDEAILEGLRSSQIAIAIGRFDLVSLLPNPMINPMGNAPIEASDPPNFWAVFDFESTDLKDNLMADMEDEEYEYVEYKDFHIMFVDEFAVLFNDDVLSITNNEETSRNFIDRYLGENPRSSLDDKKSFQDCFLRLYEDSDLFIYLDLTFITESVESAFTNLEDIYSPLIQSGRMAPPENILQALGLDAFRGLSFSIDSDPEVLKSKSLILIEPNDGFFGRLMGHYGNTLPDTSFLSEDLSQATVTSFDISGVLKDLEETIAIVSPFAGKTYQTQKANFEQMLSIQLDETLIDNFSGSFYLVAGETPNTAASNLGEAFRGMEKILDQGSTYIIGINDRISFEAMLDSMSATFDPQGFYQKQEYLGASGYSMKEMQFGFGPSLFLSDQHLIYEENNQDFAKLVISMMQNPENPIFERRDVRDALNELPTDPIGITYSDAQKLLTTFSGLFSSLLPLLTESATDEESEDGAGENPFENLPDTPVVKDFRYFSITNTYKENDNIYQEGILRPKSD